MYATIFILFFAFHSMSADPDWCTEKQNSYLWKVRTTPPVYLFGTMHVPYKSVWDHIPDNVKVAFTSSQDFCLELELLNDDTIRNLSSCRLLPVGVTIDDMLPAQLVQKIELYLERIKEFLPQWVYAGKDVTSFLGSAPTKDQLFAAIVGNWRRLQPAWLMQLLSQLTEDHVRHSSTPIFDTFLERAAKGLGKSVEALEEPNDHCRPYRQLNLQQVELVLRLQLDHLNKTLGKANSTLQDNVNMYRCGNFSSHINHTPILPLPPLDTLNVTAVEKRSLEYAESLLWRAVVTRRNRRMAKRLHSMLRTTRNSTMFLGVGAGHFLSDWNVIDRLRGKGHIIEHIPADQVIEGLPIPENIVSLGDPKSTVRLLRLSATDAPEPSNAATISDKLLKEVWNRLLATPSSTPSLAHKPKSSGSRLLAANEKVSWESEVRELFQMESGKTTPTSAAWRLTSCLSSCLTVLLVSIISVIFTA